MAKRNKEPTPNELASCLLADYTRWQHIYEQGCTDLNWEDGVNINLVRNHILYDKEQIEEHLGDNLHLYPDCYFFPLPLKLPNDFMAVERKLNCRGKVYPATKTLPYEEVMKFDWTEVMPK